MRATWGRSSASGSHVGARQGWNGEHASRASCSGATSGTWECGTGHCAWGRQTARGAQQCRQRRRSTESAEGHQILLPRLDAALRLPDPEGAPVQHLPAGHA